MLDILSRLPGLFGWLDKIPFWSRLDYTKKGAYLRAIKAGVSGVIGAILAGITDGTILPKGTGNATIIIVTLVLQGLDKYIREYQIKKEAEDTHSDTPITDPSVDQPVVNTDATVVVPQPEEGPKVETDATTVGGEPTTPDATPVTDTPQDSGEATDTATDSVDPTEFDDPPDTV